MYSLDEPLREAQRRAPAAAAPQIPHPTAPTPPVMFKPTFPTTIAGPPEPGQGITNYSALRPLPTESAPTPTTAVATPPTPQPFLRPPPAVDTRPSIPRIAPLQPAGPGADPAPTAPLTAGQGMDESGPVTGGNPKDTTPSIPYVNDLPPGDGGWLTSGQGFNESGPVTGGDPKAAAGAPAGGNSAPTAPFGPNGYANLTTFGPGNDLRSTQVNPVFEPKYEGEALDLIRGAHVTPGAPIAFTDVTQAQRLYGAAEQTIQEAKLGGKTAIADTDLAAARQIAAQAQQMILAAKMKDFYGVNGPDFGSATADLDKAGANLDGVKTDFSPEALAARASALQLIQSLNNTPSRSDIAGQRLDLFNERSQPVLQEQLRTTGQANAALGRLGSGMVRDDLRSAVTEMDRNRSQYSKELAADTAEQELGDQLNKLGAVNGASAGFTAQDQSQAGLQMALAAARQALAGNRAGLATDTYQANANERNADLSNSQAQAALALSQGNALSGQADQEARFAGVKRADDENNRAYGLAYDSTDANLALNRGGALQQLGGANLDIARIQRGDAVDERNYLTGVDQVNAGLDLSKSDALMNIDNTRFGQGAEMRGEVRGERDYQSTLAQLAIDNAARQSALQDQLQNSQFNRQMAYLSTLLAAGQSGGDGSGAMDSATQLAYINELRKQVGGSAGGAAAGTTYTGANGGLA